MFSGILSDAFADTALSDAKMQCVRRAESLPAGDSARVRLAPDCEHLRAYASLGDKI